MAFKGNKKIDYKNCLKKLGKIHFSGLKIEDNGIELLSNSLNDVNAELVSKLKESYDSEPKIYENTLYHCAQKAIKNVFVGHTKEQALSEAYRQLALLESGCMTYKDNSRPSNLPKRPDSQPTNSTVKPDSRPSTLQRKLLTEKEATEQDQSKKTQMSISLFRSGVRKFSSMNLSNFSLKKEAGFLVGLRIHNFAKIVADACAKTYHKKEELQPDDVRNVIDKYFGKNALKVANAEGCKMLVLYENGIVDFKAKREVKSGWSQHKLNREKIYARVFQPSIRAQLKKLYPDSNVDSKAPKFLGHLLMDVALYLAKNTSEICEKRKTFVMGKEEMIRSVSSALPGQLSQHAILKGSADVRMHNSGVYIYKRVMDEQKVSGTKTYSKLKTPKPKKKIPAKPKKPGEQKKRKRSVSTHSKKLGKRLKSETDKPRKISLTKKRKSRKGKKKTPAKPKKPQAPKKRKRTLSTHKKKDNKRLRINSDESEKISPLLEEKPKESHSKTISNPTSATSSNNNTMREKTQQKTSQQKETTKTKPRFIEPSHDIPTPIRLSFGPAVTDLLPVVFEVANLSLARNSKSKICEILEDACDALVKASIVATDSEELDFKEIKTIVYKYFPGLLADLAVAHASNVVQSWEDSNTKVPLS